MTNQPPKRLATQKKDRIFAATVLVSLSLLLLFSTRASQQTRDSLVYAYSARTAQEMFHPHHLIFTPAVHVVFLALSSIHESCDAILAGQIHNIVWAVVAVLSFFFVLKHVANVTLPCLFTAGLFLVSRGVWELSTQTTMYVPALGSLALLVAFLVSRRDKVLGRGDLFLVSLLLAISVLYHQANVLICIPLGYYLVATEGRRGWKAWLTTVSLAGAMVLSAYVLAFLSIKKSWAGSEFLRFCLAYDFEICFGEQCVPSPGYWGSVGNLSIAGLRSLLDSLLWNFIFIPEYLNRVATPILGLSIAILCGWHIGQIVKHRAQKELRVFLLLWLLTYGLFFGWWLPSYQHPLLIAMFPVFLLAFLALLDLMSKLENSPFARRTITLMLVLPLVFIPAGNFYARILPLHQTKGDAYVEASELANLAPRKCFIFTSYTTWNHLRYYFDRAERTIQAKYPLSYIYQGIPVPKPYQFGKEDFILIHARYLRPEYVVAGYTPEGFNGYSKPIQWLAYMEWLFDFEYDSNHTLVASRTFQEISLSDDGPYLLLSPAKGKVNGLSELFRSLDNQIGRDEGNTPFQSWLLATHPRLAQLK